MVSVKRFRGSVDKKRILAMVLTLSVILILVLSGPASAVTVGLTRTSDTSATIDFGTTLTYRTVVDIHEPDKIQMEFLTVWLSSGSDNTKCYFDLAGATTTKINNTGSNTAYCADLSILNVTNAASNTSDDGYGYGYGYDDTNSYGYTNTTWTDYGYGYGYTSGYGYDTFNTTVGSTGEVIMNFNWTVPLITSNTSFNVRAGVAGRFNSTDSKLKFTYLSSPDAVQINAGDFRFTGTTYNATGSILGSTNVTVSVYTIGGSGPALYKAYSVISDSSTGAYNLSLPANSNYFYQPDIKKFKSGSSTEASHVGASAPMLPYAQFSTLGAIKFYLKEGVTVNITTYKNGADPNPLTSGIKDKKIGFPVKSAFSTSVNQQYFYVPADRNYSVLVFGNEAVPAYQDISNVSAYGSSPVINIRLNVTDVQTMVSGYANVDGSSTFESLNTIVYIQEPGGMVFDRAMPANMSSWFQSGADTFNASAGFYNITVPSNGAGGDVILFITGAMGGRYYGAFKNLTVVPGDAWVNGFNATLYPMLGGNGTVSLDTSTGGTQLVPTAVKNFTLSNSSGSTPGSAHVEFDVNYSSYDGPAFTWMKDPAVADAGKFSVPLLNVSISRMQIYTQSFAPLKTSLTKDQLNSDPVAITLTNFRPGGISDSFTDIEMDLFKSSAECDVPAPPSSCSLTANSALATFNPLTVVMGGGDISFRMRKTSNNITVHYEYVDLIASGPPDAAFDSAGSDTSSGSSTSEVWRFGSQGPSIYRSVIIGTPFAEGRFDEDKNISVRINYLYDASWNVIWNISLNTTAQIPSDYSDFLNQPYNALINNSATAPICSLSNLTAVCYVNMTSNMIWVRIPHFSGTGTEYDTDEETNQPIITVNSPTSKWYAGTLKINATVTDGTGVSTVTYNYTGGSSTAMANVSSAYYSLLDTTAMTEQNYTFTIRATDTYGNVNQTSIASVAIDNTAPTLSLLTPTENSSALNVTINWTVADATSSVKKIWYTIDSGSKNFVTNNSNATIRTGDSIGRHTLVFSVNDSANNVNTLTRHYIINAPLNASETLTSMETAGGNDMLNITLLIGTNDVSENESLDINQTYSMEFDINASGTNVTVNIPSFAGTDANWGANISLEVNILSAKGNTSSQSAGTQFDTIVVLTNSSSFLPDSLYAQGATIVIMRAMHNDFDVLYIEDDNGRQVHKMVPCANNAALTGVAITLDNMCYTNSSASPANVTLYVPHLSGGGLANDTVAPFLNITSPLNRSLVSDSYFTFGFEAREANPRATFCSYNLSMGSTPIASANILNTSLTWTGTNGTYSATFTDKASAAGYNMSLNCTDRNNQSTVIFHTFNITDTTLPYITSVASGSLTTTAATITWTTHELANSTVHYGTTTAVSSVARSSTNATSHSISLSSLTAGTLYYYNVSSCDKAGNCNASVQSSFTTTAAAAAATRTSTSGTGTALPPGISKVWATIAPDVPANMVVSKESFSIRELTITVPTAASNVELVVRQLTKAPVAGLSGKVFNYMDVHSANLPAGSTVDITFRVDKTWFTLNSVSEDSLALYHYKNGMWNEVKAQKLMYSDVNYVYYKSTITDFSSFAIGEKGQAVSTGAALELLSSIREFYAGTSTLTALELLDMIRAFYS